MPDLDLESIRARAEAATEGPWEAFGTTIGAMTGPGDCGGCSGLLSPAHEPACYWSEIAGASATDAEFIAHARVDTPALLDEVERLNRGRQVWAESWANLSNNHEQLITERDRLAAQVERVRELAESLTEQGDEHVAGCMGQADCAACVQQDIYAALDGSDE